MLQVDHGNHLIRRVNLSSGLVNRVAGNMTEGYADGAGSLAMFDYPIGIAINADATFAIVVRRSSGWAWDLPSMMHVET